MDNAWLDPSDIPHETPSLLLTESGEIVTGWKREISDDFNNIEEYFCFGNEYISWDFEFNYDVGAVIGYMALPPKIESILPNKSKDLTNE